MVYLDLLYLLNIYSNQSVWPQAAFILNMMSSSQYLKQKIFLNLPIWANFIDPTDLSLYLPTYFRPNQFYRMDSTSSSTSTRPSQAALVEAEVEAKPIRLGRLRLRVRPFIVNTSLYRNAQLYIKANLIDISHLVIL